MKKLKWGFIGCGEVTEKKSGPAFNEVEGSSVVAVMSRSEQKARSYAERHGVPRWYTDAVRLIDDPEVNAVYVATPPSSHATFAIMSMKAGKPVYVEKPLAASYDDCARVNRISEQTGVPCFVAYYRRYLPYFQRVREIVEQGTIGQVINVQVSTIWLLTSSTSFRRCSASSLRRAASVPIVANFMVVKIRSVVCSALKTVFLGLARGALWPTSLPARTAFSSLVTKGRCASPCSTMHPSSCTPVAAPS